MKMAIDMAVQKKADIAFGTDPDSDRFGAAIPNEEGEYVLLTGNQVGCIITDYLLRSRKKKGLLDASDYIIRSFVSTHMVDEMAAEVWHRVRSCADRLQALLRPRSQ